MEKTMLTSETLDLFEKFVDISTLTAEQISDVEHCAFAANMGQEDTESAWNWFAHLMQKFHGIMLPMYCHVPRR